MASGMNGQGFTFHGYLPVKPPVRTEALRVLEADSRRTGHAQIFIETPYRNEALLAAIVADLPTVDAPLRRRRPHARIRNRRVARDLRVERTRLHALREASRDLRLAGLTDGGRRLGLGVAIQARLSLM
jgi:hypothetical protein